MLALTSVASLTKAVGSLIRPLLVSLHLLRLVNAAFSLPSTVVMDVLSGACRRLPFRGTEMQSPDTCPAEIADLERAHATSQTRNFDEKDVG